MKSVNLRLSLVENVNQFVNIVSRYPFEMDLRRTINENILFNIRIIC